MIRDLAMEDTSPGFDAPQSGTLLIECHVAPSSPHDTSLHARATVTLPALF